MSSTTSAGNQQDWTKPAAMAIPKGESSRIRWNRADTVRSFPKLRRATASRSSRKSSPEGRSVSTSMPETSRRPSRSQPDCLAVLKLHYLRWVLFPIKGETYFMYQGIFDTDFDKYTEDAVALFGATGTQYRLRKPRGLPRGLEDECRRHSSSSSASTSARASWNTANTLRERRRDQEGAQAQGGLLEHARPDAVSTQQEASCSNSTISSTSC